MANVIDFLERMGQDLQTAPFIGCGARLVSIF
jgi:hypothetical protein